MRTTEWSNWGLRFFHTPPGEPGNNVCAGFLPFPTGPNGPIEGAYGSPERQKYVDMVRMWKEKGILPDGCEKPY